MTSELPKTFDPAAIEAKWYAHWESSGAFRPSRPDAAPYTIVMPPPNVTGSLHIGHALDNTLQDILIRHARLQGKDALWVVGTDHAGIATQMVVERQMALHQDKRTNYSREDFIAKVWEWKAESGGTITQQLRRLGASCDWANERFTMDEGFSKAVIKVFVDLYNQGLLYRDKRLVNWDPHFKTAISDLEVETREVNGHMWHFKYPLAGGETYTYVERDDDGNVTLSEERDYISIATTRPETMLGDGAVAVHPGDERYKPIIGKLCEIPVGPKQHRRLIPIITDEYPDPDFGSGVVKITGAHDQNDYAVAQRNGIPMYRLMDENAAMRSDGMDYASTAERAKAIAGGGNASTAEVDALNLVPEAYRGLDRYEARKRVVADIDADGLMLRVEDKTIQQPFGDRSGVVIEPMLTDQWYVDAKTLAGPAIEAVRSGAIKVVPKSWEKTYFNWMENIQPWCVSRQLWWGHRIPAWYGPEMGTALSSLLKLTIDRADESKRQPQDEFFVAENFATAKFEALARYEAHFAEHGYRYPISKIEVFEAKSKLEAFEAFKEGKIGLWRDNDVLDTWFSSALWPFGTLGWPDGADAPLPLAGGAGGGPIGLSPPVDVPTPSPSRKREGDLLARHYPNDVLISGFDILFFWDARMIMQGLHFMRDENGNGIVPWKTLYLHGLVRAADGSKMSKSKGNTVDPLGLIDQYGADALRFTLTAMESQGRDIKLDEKRVEGYRNFATKLWNAARFCQSNGIGASKSTAAPPATRDENLGIIAKTQFVVRELNAALQNLRFDEAANLLYHFVWHDFCDLYLERVKASLREGLETEECRAVASWAFDQILIVLHPFMPFITEELWHAMGVRSGDIIHASWPSCEQDPSAKALSEWEQFEVVSNAVNSARAENRIPPGLRLPLSVESDDEQDHKWLAANAASFGVSSRISEFRREPLSPNANLTITIGSLTLGTHIELTEGNDAERSRLTKVIETVSKERDALAARLNNPAFVERAKPEAVEKARADMAEKSAEAERLSAALARLG